MNEFLFLFRGGEAYLSRQSKEVVQAETKKWIGWIENLRRQERYAGGHSLDPGGKMVRGKNKVVTDGPFAEGKELVGGYFLIRAKNISEAVEMSKASPIYEYDGSVEVRPIQKMEM